MLRLACLLLLVLASAALHAREVRLSGAGGDSGGTCPDLTAAVAEANARTPRARPQAQSTAPVRAKPAAKPASARGSDDDDGRIQAPRWHSFLPGMFR